MQKRKSKRNVYKYQQIRISRAGTDRETYLFSSFIEEKEK